MEIIRACLNDLKEMETFQADTGDEGKILQEDLKEFFINGKGDRQDLIFRLELYLYAFKLFFGRGSFGKYACLGYAFFHERGRRNKFNAVFFKFVYGRA